MSCSGGTVERIHDRELIERCLKRTSYGECLGRFREKLWIARYGKGEFAASPLQEEHLFQIVVQGELHIYCIRDDGSVHSLSSGHGDYILGDMDIFSDEAGSVYAEARTDLVCLAISIEENKAELLNDNLFLLMLCRSLTRKMQMLTALDASPASLRQRMLTYMRYRCSCNELRGLEQAAFHLNCSSRQLQRILNQYEAEGVVARIGKGAYRLVSTSSDQAIHSL